MGKATIVNLLSQAIVFQVRRLRSGGISVTGNKTHLSYNTGRVGSNEETQTSVYELFLLCTTKNLPAFLDAVASASHLSASTLASSPASRFSLTLFGRW